MPDSTPLDPVKIARFSFIRSWMALFVGALLTGLLVLASLPLGEQWWIAYFALVPLMVVSRGQGFVLGFVGGIVSIFFCAWLSTKGIIYSAKNFEPSTGWTYTSCGLFAVSFSVFFALWSDRKMSQRPLYWLASLAVLLECIMMFQLPAHLALTQYRIPLQMLVASVGGVYLVSFLVWLSNLCIARAIEHKEWKRAAWVPVFVVLCGITSFLRPGTSGNERTFAMVQVPSELDEQLVAEHKRTQNDKPEFAVWPEFAGIIFVRGDDTSKLVNLAKESGVPIVTSFPDTFKPLPHNVAAMFHGAGESKRYNKRRLFGSESKMHTPGSEAVAITPPGKERAVGLNICFDSCYPWIIHETASQPNVDLVALPTIDPESPHYFLAAMHAAYTPFRSAESGVAIIRADGHYGSMATNAAGFIVSEMKNEVASKVVRLDTFRRWTVHNLIGETCLYLMAIAVVFGSLNARLPKRGVKPIDPSSTDPR